MACSHALHSPLGPPRLHAGRSSSAARWTHAPGCGASTSSGRGGWSQKRLGQLPDLDLGWTCWVARHTLMMAMMDPSWCVGGAGGRGVQGAGRHGRAGAFAAGFELWLTSCWMCCAVPCCAVGWLPDLGCSYNALHGGRQAHTDNAYALTPHGAMGPHPMPALLCS